MSLSSPPPSVPPVSTRPARRSDTRFLIVWAILVGALVFGWAVRDHVSTAEWIAVVVLLYLGPIKIATVVALTTEERRQFTPGRLLAYFIWIGAQPRPFLPSYVPPGSAPVPTWRGFLLNLLTGVVVLLGVPWLFPAGTPLLVRAWTGLVGLALVRLFAGFDLWALVFRLLGFPVEKAWDNPAAATSLRDFWGRRWNRIMSGMMRDLLFTPLARWIGATGAAFVVFLYSGVLHEFLSLLAQGGYGGPSLYFVIQGVGFLCEGTRLGRRFLVGHPVVGWCWTALVVITPLGLIVPPAFMIDLVVPILRETGVPGLPEG
jgi:alginate O-acetyltransferase complex protein AlgI